MGALPSSSLSWTLRNDFQPMGSNGATFHCVLPLRGINPARSIGVPSKHSSRCPSLRSGELMPTQIKVTDRTHATMPLRKQAMSEFKEYAAWDAPTR